MPATISQTISVMRSFSDHRTPTRTSAALTFRQQKSAPGVLTILTGKDASADGIGAIPHSPDWQGPPDAELRLPEGFEVYLTDNTPLPVETVCYVGEGVALVVAETAAEAADAAELIEVDYAPLPAVTDSRSSMKGGAVQIWPDCPSNVALTCEVGDDEAANEAFARAAYIVRLDSRIHRITGSPMEPRAVVGEYDTDRDFYTLRAASGRGAVQTRERLAVTLGVEKEQCRAVFGDMGGNFGTRNAFSPEFALMPWAARKVGRPVKWTANRTECFLSDYQARDLYSRSELALDTEGNFLALRGENTLNLGAYTVYFWPLRKGLSMMQGTYNIPAIHYKGHAVLTNTAPTAVYRSAGRPEAIYMIERLIDLAAEQHGFDKVDLRRRNLIQSDDMPFTNGVGVTYDSGDYTAAMDAALHEGDWNGFEARKAESAARGLCRGRGIANYIEVTSGIPRERAEITVTDDGYVDLVVGTMSSGQGHETSFPQLLSEWLEVPFEKIRLVVNDTNRVSVGGGSHSGRSMRLVSIAAGEAVEALLEKEKRSQPMQCRHPSTRLNTPKARSMHPAAAASIYGQPRKLARVNQELPKLEGIGDIVNRVGGYPYGAHACEVEVDPETGHVDILEWTAVDDVGVAVNPLILHGQAHGAAVQESDKRCLKPSNTIQDRAAPDGFLYGLRYAPCRQHAALQNSGDGSSSEFPPSRHPARRRRRNDTGTRPTR